MKGIFKMLAIFRPTVVFPAPIIPTNTIDRPRK